LEVPRRESEPVAEVETEEVESAVAEAAEVPDSESTGEPVGKSGLEEMFVPRENFDEGNLDMFEAKSERSDASYFEESQRAEMEAEESIEVIVEDLGPDESGAPPRRRRRRSRERRQPTPTTATVEAQPEPASEVVVEAESAEEAVEPLPAEVEQAVEAELVEPDAEPTVEAAPAEGDRSRSRRRSRRRRRPKSSESAARGKEESLSPKTGEAAPAAEPKEAEADYEDDLGDEELENEGLEEEERSSDGKKSKSKKITGWVEAVSVLVDANIERHKKGDSERSRGGRSRGRRGR
jgi:hypothetical protein